VKATMSVAPQASVSYTHTNLSNPNATRLLTDTCCAVEPSLEVEASNSRRPWLGRSRQRWV